MPEDGAGPQPRRGPSYYCCRESAFAYAVFETAPLGRSWSRVIADRLRVILDAAVERIGGPNLPQIR